MRRRRVASWVIAGVLLLAPAVATVPAEAVCGATHRFRPLHRVTPDRAPVAIGDSVIAGAIPQLQRVGFEVDIRGCRQMSEGLRVLRRRRRAGTLPSTVVIALGTNAAIKTAEIRRALQILGRNRVLGLVTQPLGFSVSRRGSILAPVLIAAQSCFGGAGRIEFVRRGLKEVRVSGTGRFRRTVAGHSARIRFAGRFTRSGRARGECAPAAAIRASSAGPREPALRTAARAATSRRSGA